MAKVTVGEWVEAMRDGSHKFGKGALRNGWKKNGSAPAEPAPGSHCALGVLADKLGLETSGQYDFMIDGTAVGGSNLGGRIQGQLINLGLDPYQIAARNDAPDNDTEYGEVIEYITCEVGVDPDTVIEV